MVLSLQLTSVRQTVVCKNEKRDWKQTLIVVIVFLAVFVPSGLSLREVQPGEEVHLKAYVGLEGFSTIQDAINAANANGTVRVLNGTYYEHVLVNKSVILVGDNWATTIIDGNGTGDVVKVTANNTRISGFNIQNGGISAMSITNCHSQNISGNIISVNGSNVGVYIENSGHNLFLGNNITRCGWPMKLQNSNNNTILRNFFFENYGQAISLYQSQNNTIRDNMVRNNPAYGIYLEESKNNTVSENTVTDVCEGIHLSFSNNNMVIENIITRTSPHGIILEYSNSTIMRGNTLEDDNKAIVLSFSHDNIVVENNVTRSNYGAIIFNSGGNTFTMNRMTQIWLGSLDVYGLSLSDFMNSIDVSNTIDGKPVYYWMNQHDREVPSDAGCVAIINSTNIKVKDLNLTNNYHGVLVAFSNHTTLDHLWISHNFHGLWLLHSSENTITGCTLKDNINALYMRESNSNLFYGNNFVGEQKPDVAGTVNRWDNGYPNGGNYWSSHISPDNFTGISQNITGGDGLADRPYMIDSGNMDRFPSMATVLDFDAGQWNGSDYYVRVVSNSTIAAFRFNATEGPFIRFNVTGLNGTIGFCRISIERQLLWAENEEWNVTLNDRTLAPTVTEDEDYTYLFFTYAQESGLIVVHGTHVIPEYPLLFLTFLLIFTVSFIVIMARRLASRPK